MKRVLALFLVFSICIGLVTYPSIATAERNTGIEKRSVDMKGLNAKRVEAPVPVCGTPNFHDFNVETAHLPKLSVLGETEPLRPIVVGQSMAFWAQDSWKASNGIDDDGVNGIDDFAESMYSLTATVQRVGTHCYVVVEDGQTVSSSDLGHVMNEFDSKIYPTDTSAFGNEPNVDGDTKIFILLMDIRDQNYHDRTYPYYIAGYFWSLHEYRNSELPSPYSGFSNEKEIVHIDLNPGSVATCEGTIAHEFEHMIHWNQDRDEETWVDEGCADLAEFLCYSTHPTSHVNAFLSDTDVQLTTWGGSGSTLLAHYGASYLFMLYLWEKHGETSTIQSIVQDAANGIVGIQNHLGGTTFSTVFTRWTVANRIDNMSIGPSPFYYGYANINLEASLSPSSDHSTYPYSRSTTVNYWAADYIRFTGGGSTLTLGFDGDDANVFKVEVIKRTGAGVNTVEAMTLNAAQQGTLAINDFGTTYTNVILVVSSQSQLGGKTYQYSASIGEAPPPPPPGPSTPFFHPHTEFWFTWYDFTGYSQSEVMYDDGSLEDAWYWEGPGGMFAVRFTAPTSGNLKTARFYIYSLTSEKEITTPVNFKVHVMNPNRIDIITPFTRTVSSVGWFDVDLSAYSIPVSAGTDFYIAMESMQAVWPYGPSIGADTSSPDGRSWDYDGVSWALDGTLDYMVRAVLEAPRSGADIDNIHFVNPTSNPASVAVSIGSASSPLATDSFTIDAGGSTYKNYPGVIGGPVHITSDQPVWATQRIVGWSSFKEVFGMPGDMASTEIYYTWYDMAGASWDAVHFLNPSGTSTAHAQVYIAGVLKGTVTVDPGGAAYVTYPSVIGGPVRIVSDIPIFSTQRVVGWNDFDEVVGLPSWCVYTEHWFNWHDSVGASWDAVHFINLQASTATITVSIAGSQVDSFALGAGEATWKTYSSVSNGPVHVVSTLPIRVTQRIVGWSGFKEVYSVPTELMSTQWYFNWYDTAATQSDKIYLSNPSQTETATINIYIHGILKGTITLNPGQTTSVTYPSICDGPILVQSNKPIMTSQRIVGWSSFEETLGVQWT